MCRINTRIDTADVERIHNCDQLVVKAHLEVFPSKELDAHDGEDEPEDEADQQDVEDAGDGLDESIHYDLKHFDITFHPQQLMSAPFVLLLLVILVRLHSVISWGLGLDLVDFATTLTMIFDNDLYNDFDKDF